MDRLEALVSIKKSAGFIEFEANVRELMAEATDLLIECESEEARGKIKAYREILSMFDSAEKMKEYNDAQKHG